MALITSENFDAIMAALSNVEKDGLILTMHGWVLLAPDEVIREGMEQCMPNGEWWPLDYRIEARGPITPNDITHAIAFRKKVV